MHLIKNIFKPFGPAISSIFLVELILFLTIAYLSYAAENKRLFKEKDETRDEWNKKAQIGSVSTEISKVVVGNEKAIEKFKEMLSIRKNVGYESRLDIADESIIHLGKYGVDFLFREIVYKIDGENSFVKRHYDERKNKESMVSYLNQELLPEDTFSKLFIGPALQIDQSVCSVVNMELDGMLKDMLMKKSKMTYEELRKRMPDSRQICEEIYTCLNNGMTEKEAISHIGDKLKVTFGYAVKDIIKEYQKKDIFKNAEIVVDETPGKKKNSEGTIY